MIATAVHPHRTPPLPALGSRGTAVGRIARFVGRNWARVGYAYHVEPTWLAVNRLELPVRGLPPALSGLKVAQLSDFHFGPHIPPGYLENAVARAAAEKPDLIALTGDFIDRGPGHVSTAARLFRHLKAPHGVFAVLGNHDYAVHTARGRRRHPELHREVADALGTEGVDVLRNKAVRIERDGTGLIVAGIEDLWSGVADPNSTLAGQCPDTPRVILAHNPQSVESSEQFLDFLNIMRHISGQLNTIGHTFVPRKAPAPTDPMVE